MQVFAYANEHEMNFIGNTTIKYAHLRVITDSISAPLFLYQGPKDLFLNIVISVGRWH